MTEKLICALCGKPVSDGLRIHGEMFCLACESRLIKLKPNDDDYGRCLAGLRDLWARWTAEPKEELSTESEPGVDSHAEDLGT
ncbi:MAG TPA: sigma factor G inhibitor Gin [Bacillota bacterium]